MTNKGIPEIPLFDPISQKMDCPLFGVTTVTKIWLLGQISDKFPSLQDSQISEVLTKYLRNQDCFSKRYFSRYITFSL